jgi:hypothetical protein
VPCFWHSRIQAGDLSSHIYNAWLVLHLEHHPVAGLTVVNQWTNVLFDLTLTELLRRFGAQAAQAIAVSVCVLIFFWGAMTFIHTLAQKPVWWLAPLVATLTYGWLFHSGFFNFYLSLGLSFFAVSCWLKQRKAAALVLVAIAAIAHLLPVGWAVSVVVFLELFKRFPRYAFFAGLAAVAGISAFLQLRFVTLWSPIQLGYMTGFDQLNLFGRKYQVIVVGSLTLIAVLFRLRIGRIGARAVAANPIVQLFALLSLAMFAMPISVKLPGYIVLLAFLPNRFSITAALVLLAVIAGEPPAWARSAVWVLMLGFGAMIERDTRAYNRLEDELLSQLERNARGQSVVLAAPRPNATLNMVTHMVDRACIGICFSYANYEPSTLAFRLRATADNPVVTSDYKQSFLMQQGQYLVTRKYPALLQANVCPDGVRIEVLEPGEIAGKPRCAPGGQ